MKKPPKKVEYLWQLGVFFFSAAPTSPKQPRTSFPFYKLFYTTISGRISESNRIKSTLIKGKYPEFTVKKTWNILNWEAFCVHTRFSSFLNKRKRKTMFEFIINLSARNCSISRLSSKTHGDNKVEERKKKSTVAFRSDMATHWIWVRTQTCHFRSFLYQITGDLSIFKEVKENLTMYYG